MKKISKKDALRIQNHLQKAKEIIDRAREVSDDGEVSMDDVLYLFHVYLDNPDVTIYVCYHDGTEKKIVLKRQWKWRRKCRSE